MKQLDLKYKEQLKDNKWNHHHCFMQLSGNICFMQLLYAIKWEYLF